MSHTKTHGCMTVVFSMIEYIWMSSCRFHIVFQECKGLVGRDSAVMLLRQGLNACFKKELALFLKASFVDHEHWYQRKFLPLATVMTFQGEGEYSTIIEYLNTWIRWNWFRIGIYMCHHVPILFFSAHAHAFAGFGSLFFGHDPGTFSATMLRFEAWFGEIQLKHV